MGGSGGKSWEKEGCVERNRLTRVGFSQRSRTPSEVGGKASHVKRCGIVWRRILHSGQVADSERPYFMSVELRKWHSPDLSCASKVRQRRGRLFSDLSIGGGGQPRKGLLFRR